MKSVHFGYTFGDAAVKMGIKEFRERLSEVTHGTEAVDITHHGRVVAEFRPVTVRAPSADPASWLDDRIAFRKRWQENTPNWLALLGMAGLDGEGEPFDEPTFR